MSLEVKYKRKSIFLTKSAHNCNIFTTFRLEARKIKPSGVTKVTLISANLALNAFILWKYLTQIATLKIVNLDQKNTGYLIEMIHIFHLPPEDLIKAMQLNYFTFNK